MNTEEDDDDVLTIAEYDKKTSSILLNTYST